MFFNQEEQSILLRTDVFTLWWFYAVCSLRMGCKAWENGEYKKSEVIIKDNDRKEKLLRNRFIKVYNGGVCGRYSHSAAL